MTLAVLVGILAASAVGSIHCVAMCGPLAGLHGGARSLRLAGIHSLGRLATYATLGALAGALGGALDLAGRVGNIQRAATLIAGAIVVAWGLWQLARVLGIGALAGRARRAAPSSPGAFGSALVTIRKRRPGTRAALAGMLTGLLPCGWLWAFVVTAGGTASPLRGAAVMAAFWLGTVPAMVGLLAFAGPSLARLRARMPAITAVALIVLGLGSLALRWRDAGATQVSSPHCAHCHGAAS